jgi:hypothetical protein
VCGAAVQGVTKPAVRSCTYCKVRLCRRWDTASSFDGASATVFRNHLLEPPGAILRFLKPLASSQLSAKMSFGSHVSAPQCFQTLPRALLETIDFVTIVCQNELWVGCLPVCHAYLPACRLQESLLYFDLLCKAHQESLLGFGFALLLLCFILLRFVLVC